MKMTVDAFDVQDMRSCVRAGRAPGVGNGQRGAALAVSLILLVVVALLGLTAMRGTVMQQKMAANAYDREVAFQSAEAAMRVAAAALATNPTYVARNCQTSGTVCRGNPFTDPTLPAGSIHDVTAGSGLSTATFDAGKLAAMQPQYVIESMGNYTNPDTDVGFGDTANSRNYGVPGPTSMALYYRITARSGDPAKVGDRAVVTLQAVLKQG
jgi:type IV pilus assembly protein PilX